MRSSALWGTGGRGGDSRSSALWGKGGRGFVVTAVAVLALGAPLAATAAPNGNGSGSGTSGPSQNGNAYGTHDRDATFVAPSLSAKAKKQPNGLVDVIVQSSYGTDDAASKVKGLGPLNKAARNLDLVNGVSVELPAKWVDRLAKLPGLTVTPDAPVKLSGTYDSGYSSTQLWPYESGNALGWWLGYFGLKPPTIAIVDSGIDKNRADFSNGSRVVADVNLSNLSDNTTTGDGRGHGTFVASVAAGSAPGHAGAAPTAKLVSIDVMDDEGMALTSDVIAACGWILKNKGTYNIRVANFSLHSTYPSNFGRDPLDQAVEKLWFSGVTVVAASGNYGNTDGTPSGVKYAPGNDPFVITVGALDLGHDASIDDDSIAPWSAWGYTYDGFAKPELSAAGRYMVGAVPSGATLASERPDKVVAPGYMELSGTSFSAPVVSGTAAQILAVHPDWTPDQVKGALMKTARPVPGAQRGQSGVGQINAVGAMLLSNAPNPNKGLDRFLTTSSLGGTVFDAVSWYDAAMSDVSWNSVSWADVSWADVSWADVSWADVSWADVSWADVSWSDVSWADVSWADSAKEDAVDGEETNGPADGITLDDADAAELASDPALNPDPSLTDSPLQQLLAGTDTTPSTDSTSTDSTSSTDSSSTDTTSTDSGTTSSLSSLVTTLP